MIVKMLFFSRIQLTIDYLESHFWSSNVIQTDQWYLTKSHGTSSVVRYLVKTQINITISRSVTSGSIYLLTPQITTTISCSVTSGRIYL